MVCFFWGNTWGKSMLAKNTPLYLPKTISGCPLDWKLVLGLWRVSSSSQVYQYFLLFTEVFSWMWRDQRRLRCFLTGAILGVGISMAWVRDKVCLAVFVYREKERKLRELIQIMVSPKYQVQDSQCKEWDLSQDKNSFLQFCSCDSSLVFNISTEIQGTVICVFSGLIWEFLWMEVKFSLINLEFLG